jgi:adhesin/invasin
MTTTITAVLLLDGEPVDNAEIAFATDIGTLSSPTGTTNSAGEATVILTPSLTSGVATINVTWQGLSESTEVTIATGEVLMQVEPTTITANTADTADVTVTVFLDGNPVVNGIVTFTTNSTQVILSDSTAQTDDFGMATITLSPGTTAEYVEITANWENITDQRIVTIVE